MGVSDPVIYPARGGSAEAVRQDIWRTRVDLDAALGELLTRFDARAMAKRRLRTARRAGARDSILIGGVGTLASLMIGTVPILRRHWRIAAVVILGVAAGAFVVTRRRPAIAPVAAGWGSGNASAVTSGGVLEAPLDPYPSPSGGDVVDVLIEQHRRVEALLARVRAASGPAKFGAFTALVEMRNRHEHAEQQIVHPLLSRLDSVQNVAAERLAEESAADRQLARLISMGVDDPAFDKQFAALAAAIAKHAAAEEADEFPLLRAHVATERLQSLANQVRAAQSGSW